MSIDHFVSRFWRVVSIIAFGLTLLFTYRGLPDPTAVHFGESGRGDGFLPKEEIFYLMAGIVTFLNVLVLLLIKNLEKIPSLLKVKLFSIFKSKGEVVLRSTLLNWFHFLPAALNTYLIFVLRALLLLNDERTYSQDFSYLLWLAYILLCFWVLYFPIRLFLSKDFQSE
ncbi:MAG: hypothetical protein RJA76_1150 [Bacteroidota bacterium]|jgi:uncharacterized membrane protein